MLMWVNEHECLGVPSIRQIYLNHILSTVYNLPKMKWSVQSKNFSYKQNETYILKILVNLSILYLL